MKSTVGQTACGELADSGVQPPLRRSAIDSGPAIPLTAGVIVSATVVVGDGVALGPPSGKP
jgi:hypothetical protein